MKSASKHFMVLACAGQLAALFPFAVMGVAVSGENAAVWHFVVIFVLWTAIREIGWGIGTLAEKIKCRRISAKLHPLINFLAQFCCVFPVAALITAGVLLKLQIGVFFYTLPPSVAIFFGGYFGVGRSYFDVFTTGWFAAYPISAILASLMIKISKLTEAAPWVGRALCAGFAVEILLFVVKANQANIDKCTRQRDAGKAALPRGLRRYNAVIVAGIFAVSLGLFVFAEPIGKMFVTAFTAVVSAVIFVMDWISNLFGSPDGSVTQVVDDANGQPGIPLRSGADLDDLLLLLYVIAAVVLIIAFRKRIWRAFKRVFAAVFRNRDTGFDTPYADEIMSSDAKSLSPRAVKKAERDLSRQYARETSPKLKYRLGYALFLARLRHTEHPPEPSDTTNVHSEKGERAWGVELSELSGTYDGVRYGDITPTSEELAAEAELLKLLEARGKR